MKITPWAISHGWKIHHAQQLGALAKKIGKGAGYREEQKSMAVRHNPTLRIKNYG